jgi:Transposase DDE domain group 1
LVSARSHGGSHLCRNVPPIAGTIRLKLLKLGALVTVSVRGIKIAIASACPLKDVFAKAHERLCPIAA